VVGFTDIVRWLVLQTALGGWFYAITSLRVRGFGFMMMCEGSVATALSSDCGFTNSHSNSSAGL